MPGRFSRKLKLIISILTLVFAIVSWVVTNSAVTKPTTAVLTGPHLAQSERSPDVLSETVVPITSALPTVSNRIKAKVVRVVDGDTIKIEGGKTVRYIGIDTPETVKPNTPVQCFGKEASEKNKELVEGKDVELEKDVSETDRYGRLLRYVYVDGVMVNKLLVELGYAYSSSYPPDIKYQQQFNEVQRAAQTSMRGLWSSCPRTP